MKATLRFVAALCLICVPAVAQQRPAITGIAFSRMYAQDMSASDAFYQTLGLEPETVGTTKRYAVSDAQWAEIVPLPSPAPEGRLAAVGLTTRDAAGMVRYLKAKGVAIDEPLRNGMFGVHDPEGHKIIFVQTGTHKMSVAQKAAWDRATSHRIIHAGFIVHDRAAEDRFYREILGFTPYWFGGRTDDKPDWVSLQVPDGRDWLEYMLNSPPDPTPKARGVMDHFSLGIAHMDDAIAALARNHCVGPNCTKTQLGRDGKMQLNMYARKKQLENFYIEKRRNK